MVGDLIEYYTQLAYDDYIGVIPSFNACEEGLRALRTRMIRALDAGAAARQETEEASHLVASDSEKAAILAAVERALPLCESPIEKLILPWLIAQKYPLFRYGPQVLLPGELGRLGDLSIAVVPQLSLGPYRADFALAARRGPHLKLVVVECDGKAFHGSPEQIERDRRRDAYLRSLPDVLDVIRFSGQQIYRSPKACASEAAMLLYRCWLKDNPSLDHKFKVSTP